MPKMQQRQNKRKKISENGKKNQLRLVLKQMVHATQSKKANVEKEMLLEPQAKLKMRN